MDGFGLSSIPLKFSNKIRKLGGCAFAKREGKWIPIYIELSKHVVLLNCKKTIKNILLHEIAHIIAGRVHYHDEIWKECAKYVGANPSYATRNVRMAEGRWKGVCTACGKVYQRYRKTKSINDVFLCRCKKGKFKFKEIK